MTEFSGVYIMGNSRPTLYTGVSNNLIRRVLEHKQKPKKGGFVQRYKLKKLLYYEFIPDMRSAIIREKQIKNLSRAEKLDLIKTKNPLMVDIAGEIFSFVDDLDGVVTAGNR